MTKDKMTKVKWLKSFQKECRWLEEMAEQGWFLENITLGFIYKFRKGEPKKMMYEIDRFNLPAKPTLEEIQHKEIFMDMAAEMGWQEVTHDETMTYYFCKEYEEGGINELYNEEDARKYRAEKFSDFFRKQADRMVIWIAIIPIVNILVKLETLWIYELEKPLAWYDWFCLVYVAFCAIYMLYLRKAAARMKKEMSMTRSEWEESQNSELYKVKRKLIWTTRGLSKMLKKEQEQGWVLTSVTATKYFFKKNEDGEQIYTMDSKWLTNRRRQQAHEEKIADNKDWNALNNDWQLQSVKDAQAKGWQYVCALENRSIIYRGNAATVEPLNDPKYDNQLRSTSIVGECGIYLICCGLIGGIIGFCMGYFGIWQ